MSALIAVRTPTGKEVLRQQKATQKAVSKIAYHLEKAGRGEDAKKARKHSKYLTQLIKDGEK